MIELFETSNRLIRNVPTTFTRYLYSQIRWEARLIEINGSRGVGKTTLLLQKALELNKRTNDQALFVSLDDPWFYSHSLIDTAAGFHREGGQVLFLDEVHKYPPKHPAADWASEIKNVYDSYPGLKIVYTVSSLLRLYKGHGDLSRRKTTYALKGFSLREYLDFYNIAQFPAVSPEDIFLHHPEISAAISEKIRIMPHFRKYLSSGYFPFYQESPEHYFDRLKNVINVILENDLPAITELPYDTLFKIKKLLAVIASSVPYTPNLSRIRQDLHIADHRTLLRYLYYLDRAELIALVTREEKGNQILRKPEKVYLNNTNLLYCFHAQPETGTLRETFLLNQISNSGTVTYPEHGDFYLNGKWTIEVGGRTKTREQLKEIKDGYLALDDIETGAGKTVPLWLFGFLY